MLNMLTCKVDFLIIFALTEDYFLHVCKFH